MARPQGRIFIGSVNISVRLYFLFMKYFKMNYRLSLLPVLERLFPYDMAKLYRWPFEAQEIPETPEKTTPFYLIK